MKTKHFAEKMKLNLQTYNTLTSARNLKENKQGKNSYKCWCVIYICFPCFF